jgi:hypothetical protein
MITLNGTLYVVSGTELYSVTSAGTVTLIGTIAGSGRVGMAINTTQIMITNGTSTAYVYTQSTNTLATITDVDFPSADVVHSIDTYFIINEPGTQNFWISATGDGTDWTATDFAAKEGAPYNLVTLIPNHRDVFLFGEKTYEVWRNTGDADFTFERQEGTFQERGCSARHSVANLDNTVYFLGDDRIVYKIDGYRPVRVSNHGLEDALEGYSDSQLSEATSYTYTQRGHFFYILNVSTDTWVYDATYSNQTGRNTWHKRRTGLGSGRWRVENYARAYGKHLGGDVSRGVVWELDLDTYTDDGEEIERVRTISPVFSDVRPVSISRLELKLENGVGNASDANPEVWLEISKDGGRTWRGPLIRSTGAVGKYQTQVVWRRLGRARDWVFRWKATDNAITSWYEAYMDAEVGHG